jgi:hypothetical protein
VRVLPPVYPKDFETVRQMRDYVHDKMVAELNSIRGRIPSDQASKSTPGVDENKASTEASRTISTAKAASESELKSL